MANMSPAFEVHITAESGSDVKTSSFLSLSPPPSQPMGSTISMSYVYSTPPSFTVENDADLDNYRTIASSEAPCHFPVAGSTTVTMMEFGPNPEQEDGFWHRTQTVDYIVMIEGELELSLNGGETRVVKKGDVIVQRAAMHKWKNPSKTQSAKFAGILTGAKGAVEDAVEYGGEQVKGSI